MNINVLVPNQDVLKEKGDIPYWLIAKHLGVHANTVRNWVRQEMKPYQKESVLKAIRHIKKEMGQTGA